MVMEYASINDKAAELIEMDLKGTAGCHFKVKVVNDSETRLQVDMLVKTIRYYSFFLIRS